MNGQELRIGNLTNLGVVYKIEEDRFSVCDKDGMCFSSYWAKIEPIPLTEEWMLKFGFKKTYEYKTIEFYVAFTVKEFNNRSDYSITYKENEGWRLYIASYMDIPPSVEIKYVHELQNLYFALSKKELKPII